MSLSLVWRDTDQCWHKLTEIMDEVQIPEVARFPMAGGSCWLLVWSVSAAEFHHKTSQNLREIGPSVHDGGEAANGVAGMFVLTNQNVCLVACALLCSARHGGRAGSWL